jgi:hypothetical protein
MRLYEFWSLTPQFPILGRANILQENMADTISIAPCHLPNPSTASLSACTRGHRIAQEYQKYYRGLPKCWIGRLPWYKFGHLYVFLRRHLPRTPLWDLVHKDFTRLDQRETLPKVLEHTFNRHATETDKEYRQDTLEELTMMSVSPSRI